jgi:hypothetical protein
VDRVRLYVTATTNEFDLDHVQVVYVFQIVADTVFSVLATAAANYHVSTCPSCKLVRNMPRENEMAVGPFYVNLIDR